MCYIARGGMLRPHAVSQVGTPEDRHLFRQSATITEQFTGVREDPQGFGRSIPFGCRHRRPKGQVEIQFFANAFGRRS